MNKCIFLIFLFNLLQNNLFAQKADDKVWLQYEQQYKSGKLSDTAYLKLIDSLAQISY